MTTHHTRLRISVLFLCLLAGGLVCAQGLKPGAQVLSFHSSVDDTDQPYALYLPPRFDPQKRYPLVISLHGAGSNHRLNLRRVFGKSNAQGETDVEASRSFPKWAEIDYIVASPYARGTMGYEGVAEKDVYDVLADVRERFPIDENRVYLTGLSMGGGGTLWLALTRPDIWAAIAPVCPAPPQGTEKLAPNALNFPVRFCQGGADPVVRPPGVREWAKRLEALGTKVEYIEYPGVAHNSWENAYQDGKIFEWFGQFKRNPHPERVRFASDRFKYNKAFWVELDALTPGTLASVDARFLADNRIEITTTELQGFTLRLTGHPRYAPQRPVEVTIDGKRVEAKPGDTLSYRKDAGSWAAGKYETAKKPGAEGPMSEVISSRHIYVYGTADSPPTAEVQARQKQAAKAAEWCVDRGWFLGRVMVFPRVVADKDVRPSDLESSNLVLFGTPETNKLIAQFSDRLPMRLSKDSQDYGLLYVFPIGEHYVLVNSGLPWWHVPEAGAARASSGGAPRRGSFFAGSIPAFGLAAFEDFLLFKGSADNLIAGGRFDINWRLPEAEAAKLKASGVVTVKE